MERLIGTLRRGGLDHVLIFGKRVLTAYSTYYDEMRTHLGLSKDTPYPALCFIIAARTCSGTCNLVRLA